VTSVLHEKPYTDQTQTVQFQALLFTHNYNNGSQVCISVWYKNSPSSEKSLKMAALPVITNLTTQR